jgi:hypothetical protein
MVYHIKTTQSGRIYRFNFLSDVFPRKEHDKKISILADIARTERAKGFIHCKKNSCVLVEEKRRT